MATYRGVKERSTRRYSGQLTQEDEKTPLLLSQLSTITLTLFSLHTRQIIHERDAQNILNANDVEISNGGFLTWTLTPEDTAILDDTLAEEEHQALIIWTWDTGNKTGSWDFTFVVENLFTVATPEP